MEENSTAENVPLEGGSLCLDFTNTLSWRESSKRRDLLNRFSELVLWGLHVGILEESDRQELLEKASQNSDEAKRVYERAMVLRELLFRLFSSIVKETNAEEEELSEFNSYFSNTMSRACCIRASDEGFAWSFCETKDSLDYMLDPIVKSAADLLISPDLKRVKICADRDCGWLFVDKSRNSSRRWCNMNDCGNREKARRHYQRTRKNRKPGNG